MLGPHYFAAVRNTKHGEWIDPLTISEWEEDTKRKVEHHAAYREFQGYPLLRIARFTLVEATD